MAYNALKAVPVPGTESAGATPVYRNTKSATLTTTPAPGINTVYDIIERGFSTRGSVEAFGQRRVVQIVEEAKLVTKKLPGGGQVQETKTWKYFELSPFEWLTWSQAEVRIRAYASAYRYLDHNKSKPDATLGEEGLTHSMLECDVATVFTNADLLPMIVKIAPKLSHLRHVVYSGVASPAVLADLAKPVHGFGHHLKVFSLEELQELGEKHPHESTPPTKDDVALIMYTSGSTGPPKGVMLTHANVVATVSGARTYVDSYLDDEGEVYLAFLPLAHILEFAVEMTFLFKGIQIGYGSVRTLTDASVRNCKGDIRELRPTCLAGVPAVWDSIRKAVEGKIRESSTISQSIFAAAFQLKWMFMTMGLEYLAAPLDSLVFNKIKDQVGGRLKFALSGGAPVPKSTAQFLSVTATKIISGYGMTECAAVLAIQEVSQVTTLGITGAPVTSLEVKLVDVENTSYKSTNTPKPQGEIWVRGGSVMKGYYKQDALTREAITPEGWLMTGDIAELNADGTLQIIDRKKNLVKLSNGEYIALEKLESNYKVSKYVQNICVYADPEQSYAIALIQPIEKEVRATAVKLNLYPANVDIAHIGFDELCDLKEVRTAVVASLKDIAKSIGLKPAEIIGQVYLAHEEWTPQNGLLTAAMKLQRKDIVKRYAAEIKKMYAS
ncbi:long-chain fatty acid-CoA ligase [Physocladia obscura]|uniref:Long-chain fatty acid-CoA ligase n=1 Tax=Physocladia obscura TaxID=109957 RepID=A0AAD5XC40_9FUNG|nr:long-chain fatty acid-CoA ligase [Physocladia obscura]